MIKTAFYFTLIAVFFLSGCVSNNTRNTQTYAQSLAARAMPTTPEEKDKECSWIRSEIARQQTMAQFGTSISTSPMMAIAYQSAARNNVASLESRASTIQCQSAFSSVVQTPIQGTKNNLGFDECFARCQKLTDRTKDQCFDACK